MLTGYLVKFFRTSCMEGGHNPSLEELRCIEELKAGGLIWKVDIYMLLTPKGRELLTLYDNPALRKTEAFKNFLKEWGLC